jgi:hypothetical protein
MYRIESMVRGRRRFSAASLAFLLAASLSARELAAHGGGQGQPPGCVSRDQTNSPGCYRNRSDAELLIFLYGTSADPLAPPEVCGMVVETPAQARHILSGSGSPSSPCNRLKRDALTAIFNLRRSLLFGGGRLGEDGAECFKRTSFRIVLRCGSVFVPDLETPDPDDAVVVTEKTPLADLVSFASELCLRASCPSTNSDACGKTLGKLAEILNKINESRSDEGECPICPGDNKAPVLTCPEGVLTFECTGPEGAAIDYQVRVSDNCDPSPRLTCFPPPGTVLPTGSRRTVRCEATDLKGNTSTCSFEVEVVDTTAPSIGCPAERIVVDCIEGSENGAVVNYPPPSVFDLCDPEPRVVCDPPSGSFFPLGVTTVLCTATDCSQNTSTCSFEVEVVEAATPALICSPDIIVECTSPGGEVIHYPPPVATSSCRTPPEPVCEPPPGSVFHLGSTTVTCSTTGPGGEPLECSFTITVEDTRPPVIVCPQDITAECSSPKGTPVHFEVRAIDACDPEPRVTCEPPSGSLFPPGRTAVVCTAVDASGNPASCEFDVIVVDTTAPTISCPAGPITAACTEGKGGAAVHYPTPDVSDACDPGVTLVCEPPSGAFFALGRTTVTCTAMDASGNHASCSFEVEVVDEAPPELVCVESVLRDCTGPEGAIVDYPPPMVAGDCDGLPEVTCEPPPGSLFPPGETEVQCSAMDQSGNVARCSFVVTVADLTPPEIRCPPDQIVECAGRSGAQVSFTVTATDACDPEPAVTCNPPSGSFFAPGVTVVECEAMDASGNRSTCSFQVSVIDTTAPEIRCPADRTVECESPKGTPVTFAVSAEDVCDDGVKVTCEPPSGSVFPHGESTVVCTATDSSGNSSRCEFTITVVDTTPPRLTCSSDAVRVECDDPRGAAIQYPDPVVHDACDPEPLVICEPPPGTILPPGRHTIICTAMDGAGNEAICSFELEVVDTAAPELICLPGIVRECTGPEGAAVDYSSPAASDTCDPAPRLACLPPSGSVFPLGETLVICTADDASGNMVECAFPITVVDTTPPLIQCPGDITTACASAAGTHVSFEVTATDICDPNPLVTCEPPSGHLFPPGKTTVECTARDREGNVSRCSFTVTVRDEMPPQIVCPESFETECTEGGMAVIDYPPPAVFDDCDPEFRVICEPPPGTLLPLGVHIVRCSATDAAGNEASCEFTVTVAGAAPPVLICSPDLTVQCEGPGGTRVDYAPPVVNDACNGPPVIDCQPPPGSLFPLGQTEVVCTASGKKGEITRCTFLVSVVDTLSPEITCPKPIVAECTSKAGAIVEFSAAASDLCDPAPELVCDPPSGSLFPPGQTMVTCVATDASGNRSTCSFPVTVLDRTAPELACPAPLKIECTTAGEPAAKPAGWPPTNDRSPIPCTTAVQYAAAAAADGCQTEAVQVTCTPAAGTRLALGTHTVTCRARDRAGNESTCTFTVEIVQGPRAFVRGDANEDASVDIGDAIYILNYLFSGGRSPRCADSADANDDGSVNMADPVYILGYLFMGGPRPKEPFLPLCGLDTTPDKLGCDRHLACE